MVLNKNLLFIILIVGFLSHCRESKKVIDDKININNVELDSIMNIYGEKIAILSCLRCQCFVDDYNIRFYKSGLRPKGYVLITDTSCNKLLFSTKHIPNNKIEKISDDIYNLTLFKKNRSEIKAKIVAVEDSERADIIAEKFFKVN